MGRPQLAITPSRGLSLPRPRGSDGEAGPGGGGAITAPPGCLLPRGADGRGGSLRRQEDAGESVLSCATHDGAPRDRSGRRRLGRRRRCLEGPPHRVRVTRTLCPPTTTTGASYAGLRSTVTRGGATAPIEQLIIYHRLTQGGLVWASGCVVIKRPGPGPGQKERPGPIVCLQRDRDRDPTQRTRAGVPGPRERPRESARTGQWPLSSVVSSCTQTCLT